MDDTVYNLEPTSPAPELSPLEPNGNSSTAELSTNSQRSRNRGDSCGPSRETAFSADNTILNSNVGEPNLNSKNEIVPEGSVKLNWIQENKGEVVQKCDMRKKQLDEVLNLNDDGVRVLTSNKINARTNFTEKDVDNMEAEDYCS